MVWLLTGVTFLATMSVVIALFFAFTSKRINIAARLSRFAGIAASTTVHDEASFSERQRERVRDSFANLGKLLPPASQKQASRTQLMTVRAGFRSAEAVMAMRGFKLLFPIALIALAYFTGFYRVNEIMVPLIALAIGYLFPDMLLSWFIRARQTRLRRGLPDALDLMVICVEAGLGLDQAMMKVSQDMRIAHRELSDELQLVNLEMRVGKTRIEALRELSRRTGLEDVKSLVAMLIQTERFGTSIAQSLRVFSDDMRVKRRQRAEEMSAKTTVKMVPPLVFFIFPALMVVILGPAVLMLMSQLMPAMK